MFKSTILVADDEEMVLDVAKEMLHHLEYNVIAASNGIEALELYNQHKDSIDLLIFDISMPKMDGFTCLASIRQESNVPALLSSGISQTLTEEDIAKHKAQGVLPKPFSFESLQQAIESILG